MVKALGIIVGLVGLVATVLVFTGAGGASLQNTLSKVPFIGWPIMAAVGFAVAAFTRRPSD